ncbi:MAG: GNAT family N-acetyltransferase [Prevotella sp.]|nr:GNAT family N-acetyltransferase [Prevotella sp.]
MRENKLPDVILRAMEPEDLDMMYAIENDHDTWSVTDVNTPYSRFVLHEFIANATGDIYTDKQVRLIVTNKSGEFIGMIDLFNFNPQHKRAEIGIIIRKEYREQGYGKAALLELINYAQRIIHIHQLYVYMSVDNTSCVKLFDDTGFERDAELKDWLFDGDKYHNVYLMHFFVKKRAKVLWDKKKLTTFALAKRK